jgi:hypothetical protein
VGVGDWRKEERGRKFDLVGGGEGS